MGEDWIFFQKINIWGEADSINGMGERGQEILNYKQVIYLHKVESSLRNLQVIRGNQDYFSSSNISTFIKE